MSLSSVIASLKQSKIYSAKFNGEIVGFRVKIFDVDTRQFNYYDFDKSTVAGSEDLKNYINNNYKSFDTVTLILHNGSYCSQEEINGQIVANNFKDTNQAIEIIGKVIKINQLGDQV